MFIPHREHIENTTLELGRIELPPASKPRSLRPRKRGETATFLAEPSLQVRVVSVLVTTYPQFCKWSLAQIAIQSEPLGMSLGPHLFDCTVDKFPAMRLVHAGERISVTVQNVDAEPCTFGVALLVIGTWGEPEPTSAPPPSTPIPNGPGRFKEPDWLPHRRMPSWNESRRSDLLEPNSSIKSLEQSIVPMRRAEPEEAAEQTEAERSLRAHPNGVFRVEHLQIDSDSCGDVEIGKFSIRNLSLLWGNGGGCPVELFMPARSPRLHVPTSDITSAHEVSLINHGAVARYVVARLVGPGLSPPPPR